MRLSALSTQSSTNMNKLSITIALALLFLIAPTIHAEMIKEGDGPILVGEQTTIPVSTQSTPTTVQFDPVPTINGTPIDMQVPIDDAPSMPAGTPGGGALPTGALNANSPQPPAASSTPQSGSSELSQCSNLKIVSLLDFLIWIKCIIVVAIIPLIFALALMFFLWGVMKFIMANDSTKREEGRKFILGGLIGLFVMTSLWGIVRILGTTLGLDSAVPLLQTECLTQNGCTPPTK